MKHVVISFPSLSDSKDQVSHDKLSSSINFPSFMEPTLDPIPSQLNPVHTLIASSVKAHFGIIFLSQPVA